MTRARVGTAARLVAWAFVAICLVPIQSTAADEMKEAEIEMSTVTIGLGLGYNWGTGVIRIGDTTHPFTVENIKIVAIGVTKVHASGTLRLNPAKIEDVRGTYVVFEAGLVVGGGGSFIRMVNQKGVALTLVSVQTGFGVFLGTGGMTLELN